MVLTSSLLSTIKASWSITFILTTTSFGSVPCFEIFLNGTLFYVLFFPLKSTFGLHAMNCDILSPFPMSKVGWTGFIVLATALSCVSWNESGSLKLTKRKGCAIPSTFRWLRTNPNSFHTSQKGNHKSNSWQRHSR